MANKKWPGKKPPKKPEQPKYHLGWYFLSRALVYSVIFWLVCGLFDYILNGIFIEWLYDLVCQLSHNIGNTRLTFFFKEIFQPHVYVFIALLYAVGLVIVGAACMRRPTRYLHEISAGIDSLLDTATPIGPFSAPIRSTELSLKDARYKVLRNQQLAHEAEQRKDDLVVYLAHDLKTPLASVIGYLTLLEESPDLPIAARAKYTSITLDKAYRLEQLINELFDITRYNMQSVVLERNLVNLTRMLQQMIDEFYPIFSEKNLQPVSEIESGLSIIADSDKLARVFDNLLRNAVAYSYEDTPIRIFAAAQEETVTVKVRNSGDEIPPEKLANIFDKFFRADLSRSSRSGGAGLGLAIAKQIVELHGGTISAESNTEFTEFTVVLPKISDRSGAASHAKAVSPSAEETA